MIPVAIFSLSTGLVAAIGLIVMKIKAIKKAGQATKRDKFQIAMLALLSFILIANIVIVAIYF